jgi:hypothetical protein
LASFKGRGFYFWKQEASPHKTSTNFPSSERDKMENSFILGVAIFVVESGSQIKNSSERNDDHDHQVLPNVDEIGGVFFPGFFEGHRFNFRIFYF